MYSDAGQDARTIGVDRGQLGEERIDRSESEPFALADDPRQYRFDKTLADRPLRQIEAEQSRKGDCGHDCDRLTDRGSATYCGERREAEESEQEQGDSLDKHVDDHARRRKRCRRAAQDQRPGPDDVSADLCHRQQRIGALAQEADGHAGEDIWPRDRGEQDEPAEAGAGYRRSSQQNNTQDAPSCRFERV